MLRLQNFKSRVDRFVTAWERRTGILVERQAGPLAYATHIPILVALARLRPIYCVLELGCGQFSTLTIANRAAFPHLQLLRTVENDPHWAREIAPHLAADSRIELIEHRGPISKAVGTMDLNNFDTILIDDSVAAEERIATIREVSKHRHGATVIMHDFEYRPYRKAARAFQHIYRFMALNPNTAVGWAGGVFEPRLLGKVDRFIAHSTVPPHDTTAWITELNNFALSTLGAQETPHLELEETFDQ